MLAFEEGMGKDEMVAELKLGWVKWGALGAKFKEEHISTVEPISSLLISQVSLNPSRS